jgi:hypothetical protein
MTALTEPVARTFDPVKIRPTHANFRAVMDAAGEELERLDEAYYQALTEFWVNGNDELARYKLEKVDRYAIKFYLLRLREDIKATFALWMELRDEMD